MRRQLIQDASGALCPLLCCEIGRGCASHKNTLHRVVLNPVNRTMAPRTALGVVAAYALIEKWLVHHGAGRLGQHHDAPLLRVQHGGQRRKPLGTDAVAQQQCGFGGALFAVTAGFEYIAVVPVVAAVLVNHRHIDYSTGHGSVTAAGQGIAGLGIPAQHL